MAVREINTRLVLDGGKEYRSQMQDISREYRTLQSELKLVESSFKGQQNTLAALEAKNKALNDVIAKQAEKLKLEKDTLSGMQDLQKKYADSAAAARDKLEALNKNTDEATKGTDEYKKKVAEIEAEIAKYEKAEGLAAKAVDDHTQKANNAQVKLNDLNGELKKNEQYLGEAQNSTDGCAKSIDEYGKEVKKAAEESEDFGKKSKAGIDALASALAAAGVAAAIKTITDSLAECSQASMTFESAMAGVAKTTDLTEVELAAMGDEIKRLSSEIPLTTTELAKIMETAGQLGIKKEDLVSFTEVMAALGVATNMTSDEAAEMLAQFVNITGMDTSLYSNLGSAIVALGNNLATNEKKITDMAQGIAAAGTNARMSEADMLALSGAVTSLGIESGTGGTNMSKLIGMMQAAVETGKDLDKWAKAAGMSAGEFATLWGRDATGALTAFIGNLNNLGSSASVTLQELGVNDERLKRLVTSLANAEQSSGLLTNALNLSSQAWSENTALVTEAETRYTTTESKMQLFKNSAENLKVAIGDQLNPELRKLAEEGTSVTEWATQFVRANPEMVKYVSILVMVAGGFLGVAAAIVTVTKVWKALDLAMSASKWGLVIAAIVGVSTALYGVISSARETDEEIKALRESAEALKQGLEEINKTYEDSISKTDATAKTAGDYINRLKELESQSSLTNKEQYEYDLLIGKLQQAIPGLNLVIDEQTGLLKDGAEAVRSQVEAWKDAQRMDALIKKRQDLLNAQVEAEVKLYEAELKQGEKEKELKKFEDARAETVKKLSKELGVSEEVCGKLDATQRNNLITSRIWEGQTSQSASTLEEWNRYIEACDGSIGQLTQETEDLAGVTKECTDTVDKAGESLEGYDEHFKLTGEDAARMAEETAAITEKFDRLGADIVKLQEDYDAAYKKALETIDSTFGMFEKVEKEKKTSTEEMTKNLKDQENYWTRYAANLKAVSNMGLSEEFLKAISDGSEESATYVAALVAGGAEAAQEVEAQWLATQAKKEEMATLVAETQTNFTEEMGKIKTEAETLATDLKNSTEFDEAGVAVVQSLIDGLAAQMEPLQAQVSAINAVLAQIAIPAISISTSTGKKKPASSNATGLSYVPYDNYLANLHEGEMVLTKLQAKALRGEQMTNYNMQRYLENITNYTTSNATTNHFTIHVSGAGGNGKKIGEDVMSALQRKLRHRGVLITNA